MSSKPMSKMCPKCYLEDGIQAEVVMTSTLERCVRCSTDFKQKPINKDAEVAKPLKGLKAILGGF